MSVTEGINLDEARAVAREMQRGVCSTQTGNRPITNLNPLALTEAWKQAGQIIEALVAVLAAQWRGDS